MRDVRSRYLLPPGFYVITTLLGQLITLLIYAVLAIMLFAFVPIFNRVSRSLVFEVRLGAVIGATLLAWVVSAVVCLLLFATVALAGFTAERSTSLFLIYFRAHWIFPFLVFMYFLCSRVHRRPGDGTALPTRIRLMSSAVLAAAPVTLFFLGAWVWRAFFRAS